MRAKCCSRRSSAPPRCSRSVAAIRLAEWKAALSVISKLLRAGAGSILMRAARRDQGVAARAGEKRRAGRPAKVVVGSGRFWGIFAGQGGSMPASSVAAGTRYAGLASRLPALAAGLALISLLLLAAGPLGWRAHWWHFRFAFATLMPWSACLALAGAALSAAALLRARSIGRGGALMSGAALLLSLLLLYLPLHYRRLGASLPPIHDIIPSRADLVPCRLDGGADATTSPSPTSSAAPGIASPCRPGTTSGSSPISGSIRRRSSSSWRSRRASCAAPRRLWRVFSPLPLSSSCLHSPHSASSFSLAFRRPTRFSATGTTTRFTAASSSSAISRRPRRRFARRRCAGAGRRSSSTSSPTAPS